jgi:hypothetical protein
MKFAARTIRKLAELVTGDNKLMPYRTGSVLVALFNEFGANDQYGQGFPARWRYADEKLHALNGTPHMGRLITHIFDPREFLDTQLEPGPAVDYFNEFLKFDGFQIVKDGAFFKLRDSHGLSVDFSSPFEGSKHLSHVFIDEQIAKCDEKLARDDFDGAITNARSLLEAVLTELERDADPTAPRYDGDLPKLYRRVQKQLSLDPSRTDVSDTLKQILSGMMSIVSGLAGLRNKMSDAHVQNYRPRKHHAKLAVNAAKTLSDFLFETKQYQASNASSIQP